MAFSFDSRLALSAALLCAVAALVWRLAGGCGAAARLNLRFATILFAAVGVAGLVASFNPPFAEAAFAIALLVVGTAPVALALSLFAPRPAPPLPASAALVAGLAAGLVSALMDAPIFALAAQALSAAAMVLLGFARFEGTRLQAMEIIAGALALFFGGMALASGALAGALMLFAAGLLGLACASQARVQQQAGSGLRDVIGRTGL
jgi:hypothetical protein